MNFELLWHFRDLFDGNGNEKGGRRLAVHVILFEIDSAIFYTDLHELFLSVHKLNKLG